MQQIGRLLLLMLLWRAACVCDAGWQGMSMASNGTVYAVLESDHSLLTISTDDAGVHAVLPLQLDLRSVVLHWSERLLFASSPTAIYRFEQLPVDLGSLATRAWTHSLVAGSSLRSARARDGPSRYARFVNISHISASRDHVVVCETNLVRIWDRSADSVYTVLHNVSVRSVSIACETCSGDGIGYAIAFVTQSGALHLAISSVRNVWPNGTLGRVDICSGIGMCTAESVQLVDYVEHQALLMYIITTDGALVRLSARCSDVSSSPSFATWTAAAFSGIYTGQLRLIINSRSLNIIDMGAETYVSRSLAMLRCFDGTHLLEDLRLCVPIPLGAFVDITGRLAMCPSGSTTHQRGAACSPCPIGRVLKGAICVACPPNNTTCSGRVGNSDDSESSGYIRSSWGDVVPFDMMSLASKPLSIALEPSGVLYISTVASTVVCLDPFGGATTTTHVASAFGFMVYDIQIARLWAGTAKSIWLLDPNGWDNTQVVSLPSGGSSIQGLVAAEGCYDGGGVLVLVVGEGGGSCGIWHYTKGALVDIGLDLHGNCSSSRAVTVSGGECVLWWVHNDTIWRWDGGHAPLQRVMNAPVGSLSLMMIHTNDDETGTLLVGTRTVIFSRVGMEWVGIASWVTSDVAVPLLASSSNETGLFVLAIDTAKVAVVGLWLPPRVVCPVGYSPTASGGCGACANASNAGTQRCSSCSGMRYLSDSGCRACPLMRWWKAYGSLQSCPIFVDGAVETQIGIGWADVASTEELGAWIFDYLQPFVLGAGEMVPRGVLGHDLPMQGRLWERVEPLTPAPIAAVSFRMPGLWTACSLPVLRTQSCTCRVQSRLVLPEPWGSMRGQFSPLLGPDAFFITRTDATSYPTLVRNVLTTSTGIFEYSLNPPSTTWVKVSADAYDNATCVIGWPATYTCAQGNMWHWPNSQYPGGACLAYDAVPFTVSRLCPDGLAVAYSTATYCISCPQGTIPLTNRCEPCRQGTFEYPLQSGVCVPKRVSSGNCSGIFVDMGPSSDDLCTPMPVLCDNMVRYGDGLTNCLRVSAMAGYTLAAYYSDSDGLTPHYWYRSCGSGSPPFSIWTTGPRADACYYQCLYGVLPWAPFSSGGYYEMPTSFDLAVMGGDGPSGFCSPCSRDACAQGYTRPLSAVRLGCGPATSSLVDDGCVSTCPPIPDAALFVRGDASKPCAWACMDTYMLLDGLCVKCSANICAKGEAYIGKGCGPTAERTSTCVPCTPPMNASMFVVDFDASLPGVCAFRCADGWISARASTATMPVCSPCSTSSSIVCPPGQARTCTSTTACTPCDIAPPLASIALPSQGSQCNVTCRPGYVVVSASGQVMTPPVALSAGVRCESCALWPNTSCIGALCLSGQYATANNACVPCPTSTSCAAGFYMTGCLYGLTPPVCASCPSNFLLESNASVTAVTRQWVQILRLEWARPFSRPLPPLGYPSCTAVCATHYTYDGTACVPCPKSLHAFWNASDGIRWWDVALDGNYPWLPFVRTNRAESRAGRCWPCPPATTSVFDLCDTNTSTADYGSVFIPQVGVGVASDPGQIRPRLRASLVVTTTTNTTSNNTTGTAAIMGIRRRKILSSKLKESRTSCAISGLYEIGGPVHKRAVWCGQCPVGSSCSGGVRRKVNITRPTARSTGVLSSCSQGYRIAHGGCHRCAAGYYGLRNSCHVCPLRFVSSAGSSVCTCTRGDDDSLCASCPHYRHIYSDFAGSCMMCPTHQQPTPYARHHGARSSLANSCICSPGAFPTTYEQCEPCPLGSYKTHAGQAACRSCPVGKTTLRPGAIFAYTCISI